MGHGEGLPLPRRLRDLGNGGYRYLIWGHEAPKARGSRRRVGVGCGRALPLPTRGEIWGVGYAPSPNFFSIFYLTSSSAMAERPRELDQRLQMGSQFEAIID